MLLFPSSQCLVTEVLAPASRQVMAPGEAGLAAADHDRVDVLCHAIPLVMFIVSHG